MTYDLYAWYPPDGQLLVKTVPCGEPCEGWIKNNSGQIVKYA